MRGHNKHNFDFIKFYVDKFYRFCVKKTAEIEGTR